MFCRLIISIASTKDRFHVENLTTMKKIRKIDFSMRIWIVKKLSIFFNWSCNLKRFLSTRSIWIEIEVNTKNAYSVYLFFQRFMWKRIISFFFDCWSESHRDRVALNSLKMRDELLSMMSACRSTVVRFTHASIRLRWVYAFEISQNRCSTCSLLICILYEWCSTCLQFACDIWSEFAINSDADRWKWRAFQFSKSKSKWLETIRKCFVNNDFVWLRVCWSFSIFYSWACVKRRRRKWKSSEQRRCTALESCEKSFFRWRSTTSWKSWSVSSFFLEFFVRVNLISVACRSERRELEYRFSIKSCLNEFWSWSSCRISSNFW
jgi:hypothetical protein